MFTLILQLFILSMFTQCYNVFFIFLNIPNSRASTKVIFLIGIDKYLCNVLLVFWKTLLNDFSPKFITIALRVVLRSFIYHCQCISHVSVYVKCDQDANLSKVHQRHSVQYASTLLKMGNLKWNVCLNTSYILLPEINSLYICR